MIYFLFFSIIIFFYVINDLIEIFKVNTRLVFWVFVSFSVLVCFGALLVASDIITPSVSKYLKELVVTIWNLSEN
ncbi:hypothetical protein Ccel_3012 [Ruminiclostridium cellulolyticum H10]|uniref:Uncharacterized protein n=1 Tax=Ruminiclostridium cellulolyticum (strain ATCC 35319 / DSM 5812 / JCM 6584 / H10) TaxID=394503 RepID=B8I8X4_RUMCH|nr:hypothetical protein Ccel_3012 [Ruminiclostridium cellulolyticum H10]